MHSPKLPSSVRVKAYNAFESIIGQVKDRELVRMRGGLTAALRADASKLEVKKLSLAIKDYEIKKDRNR